MLVTVGTTREAAPMWPTRGGGQEPRRGARMKGFQDFLTRFATSISYIFMDKQPFPFRPFDEDFCRKCTPS